MEITRTARPSRRLKNVKMWHCGGCGVVHMSVGKMTMDFTQEEFSNFAETVVDIQYSVWRRREESIINLIDQPTDARATVH